jgi:DNA-binding NtrC family response regulator
MKEHAAANETEKRRNPIVGRFVTTDTPLIEILRKMPAAMLDGTALALLGILECLHGQRLAREAIESAQQVSVKDADHEILTLMLAAWAEICCRIGRPSEGEAFLQRARSLVSDRTHCEVRAYAMMVESLAASTQGNQALREKTLQDILDMLPSFSPRRKFYLWEKAFLLAQQGRGSDLGTLVREMSWQCNERFPLYRVHLIQFIDNMERGHLEQASRLLPSVAMQAKALSGVERIALRAYESLHKLMSDGLDPELMPGVKRGADIPNAIRIAYALILKDSHEALRLARIEAQKLRGSIMDVGFDSYSLIRAELAARNADSAIRILKAREARGNRHYLDDFFYSRAHLLLNERKEAATRFAQALHSLARYHARARLDFELKMACELEDGNVIWLTQAADHILLKQNPAQTEKPLVACDDLRGVSPFPHDAASVSLPGMNMILGSSTAISAIRETITRFADIDAPVLITGETGTGKDLVARALHEGSRRRNHPFTPVNCGSLTETLLESELFGHERGAFTGADRAAKGLFEETGQGTILLDEIGDITPRLQATLLRVLETGEIRAVGSAKTRKIHCRILIATNVDLEQLTYENRFRKDLFFRLQRLLIHTPSLRERRGDILLLARHFLDSGRRIGVHATMAKDLRDALRAYDWPGNVRELKNVVERMRLMHSDKLSYHLDDIDAKLLKSVRPPLSPLSGPTPSETSAPPFPDAREPLREFSPPTRPANPQKPPDDNARKLRKGKSMLRRLDQLRALFDRHKKLTRGEVADIMDVSANTATKYLQSLCDDRYIHRIEPSASTRSHYFILAEQETRLSP